MRIVFNNDESYGLHPSADQVRLEIIRDVGHNETDKSRWWMIKNSDGSFSFQSYDGRNMKCPNSPSGTHTLTLTHPGTSINQKFLVELISSSVPSYRIRCKESGHASITSTGFNANVNLQTNNYSVWFFGIA